MGTHAICKVLIAIAFIVSSVAAECTKDLECCRPGTLQEGDPPNAEKGSFCTMKPFEADYKLRIGKKAPMQLNLVDYCTDEILYSSYFAPEIDKFSLVNFPCTYSPLPCSQQPESRQEECLAGKAVWDEVGCTDDGTSFYHRVVQNRVCNPENYPDGNERGYMYYPPDEGDIDTPPSKGGCNCNWEMMRQKAVNRTGSSTATYTTGVPDGFIREGMGTFYVEVVVGGRKTSENIENCRCEGPHDVSKECMCLLGTRKVPYVYNNSVLPYLTALVSIKDGRLIFKRTFVSFNFETNGIGCVGCPVDACWGVPKEGEAGIQAWGFQGFDLDLESKLMCGIRLEPDAEYPDEAFCQYPQSPRDIDACSLKVYVAWVGTDAGGHACTSSNEMFSKFTQMGVSNIAVDFYNGFSNIATTVDRRITGRETT